MTEGAQPSERSVYDGAGFIVEDITMDHRTPQGQRALL